MAKEDKPSSGFGLGGWGSSLGSWGLGGGKANTAAPSWGFDAINEDSTDIATTNSSKDTKAISTSATDFSWSSGGNKKNKKKEASSFDFDNFCVEEDKAGEIASGETGELNHTETNESDPWASSFTTAGKKAGKKDKKKKGAIEEVPEHETHAVDVALKDEVINSIGGFG